MVYDSYRPGMDSRISAFDGNEDSMFWRRDERDERRSRRPSGGASHLESRRTLSPRRSSRSRSPRPQSQRNLSISTRLDTSDHPTQLQKHSRRSSDVARHPQIRPLVSFPLPSPSAAHERQSSRNITSPHPATADLQRVKSSDPRLRLRTPNTMSSLDTAPSPAVSSTDDGLDVNDQGAGMKELIRVLYSCNELKREQEFLRNRHKEYTGQLEAALKLYTKPNAYTEKIREDIDAAESALNAKTAEVEKMKKREETALRASNPFQGTDNFVHTELQSLRAKFATEESRVNKLNESNEDLQQQVTRLVSTVNELQAQFKQQQQHITLQSNFQEQIDAIKTKESDAPFLRQDKQMLIDLKHEIKEMQEETLEKLHSDINQQKLGLARLNDVFVSQESFKELSASLDSLNARISSEPKQAQTQPGSYVTRDILQAYISTFNKFEDKIEVRLDNVEKSKWLTNDDLANYAKISDLNLQVEALKTTYDEKIKELQTRSDSFIKDVTNAATKSIKLERDFHASSEASKALSGRVEAVEGIQKTLRLQGLSSFSKTGGEKMQQEIIALQSKSQAQSNITHGLVHSVRSLNSRFNNLTSENLARQMAGIVEPMLTTIKPQITTMNTQFQDLCSAQDRIKTDQSTIASRMVNHDQCFLGLHAGIETLHKANKAQEVKVSALAADVKTVDANTKQWNESNEENVRAVQKDIRDIRDLHAVSITGMDQALRTKLGILRDYVNAENEKGVESAKANTKSELEFAKGEQQVSFDSLLQQVRDARDSIDKRLVVLEDTVSGPKDHIVASENEKTITVSPTSITAQRNDENTVNGTPGEGSQVRSNGSSKKKKKKKKSKSHSLQPSPLSRHFQSQSEIDNTEDTIDITPKPRIDVPQRSDGLNVISLTNSDQETDDSDDVEYYVYPMKDKGIDYGMWGVKEGANKRSVKGTQSVTSGSQNTNTGDSTPILKSSQFKRKRELERSNNTSKTGASSGSQPNTPRSSGQEKKRAKK